MVIKSFSHLSNKDIEEFLSLLDIRTHSSNQYLSTNIQEFLNHIELSTRKILFNDFWLPFVFECYLNRKYPTLELELTQPINFFNNVDVKNKPTYSVEHVRNGQINVYLSESQGMSSFDSFEFKKADIFYTNTFKKSLYATNHSIDTVTYEDSLFNMIAAIASTGCNRHNNHPPCFSWLNDLPNIYDIAGWLHHYIDENNLKKSFDTVHSVLEITSKHSPSPIKPNDLTESYNTKDHQMMSNAIISTAFCLGLSKALMIA